MAAIVPLSQIPSLEDLYKNYPDSHLPPRAGATSKFNSKISLIRTDITKLAVDAIVNAANESLLGGGGVDGAIHRAAGPQLVEECTRLDGCDTGSAKITDAYRLPCRKVIHAVGPVYYTEKQRGMHTRLLQGCYTSSLDLAAANGCRSIAFSALSTGVYGYPSDEAAEAAIEAVKGWLEQDDESAGAIDKVVFCQFMEKDQRAYAELIPQFFPPPTQTPTDAEMSESIPQQQAQGTGDSEVTSDDRPGEAVRPDEANEAAELGEAPKATSTNNDGELPSLPDVPTTEPAHADQPSMKKPKFERHDTREDKENT